MDEGNSIAEVFFKRACCCYIINGENISKNAQKKLEENQIGINVLKGLIINLAKFINKPVTKRLYTKFKKMFTVRIT